MKIFYERKVFTAIRLTLTHLPGDNSKERSIEVENTGVVGTEI